MEHVRPVQIGLELHKMDLELTLYQQHLKNESTPMQQANQISQYVYLIIVPKNLKNYWLMVNAKIVQHTKEVEVVKGKSVDLINVLKDKSYLLMVHVSNVRLVS